LLYALTANVILRPFMWWAHLRAEGAGHVPENGPVLLVSNHDSQWDPLVIGVALRKRRQVRYLARASLWRIPGLGLVLNAWRQIPVRRGAGDTAAMEHAEDALRSGDLVCVFPEGGLSWGERLRARSGVGRLAQACPQATIVLCEVRGTTEYARFPRRPRVSVSFSLPEIGDPRPGEAPAEVATRLLDQIRARVPPTPAGRRARVGGPPRVRRARARRASRS
jgi:1-acyl-sn-glycerol-3-phosphate acyltransferase